MSVSSWLFEIARRLGSVPTQSQPVAVVRKTSVLTQAYSSVLFVSALIGLTLSIGHRFYNDPKLDIGTIAPETIRVPQTTQIEDLIATEAAREAARRVVKVYTLDTQTNQTVQAQIQLFLNEAQKLREIAGSLPVVPVADLALDLQGYLRKAKPADWQKIVDAVKTAKVASAVTPRIPAQTEAERSDQATIELQSYYKRKGLKAFRHLVSELETARFQYQSVVNNASQGTLQQTKIPVALLELSDLEWQQTQTAIPQVVDRMLAQGILPGLSPELLSKAVQLQVAASVPEPAIAFSTTLIVNSLRANVIPDPLATQQQADVAASHVPSILLSVQKGDLIVRRGFPINQQAFVKLEYFHLSQRQVNGLGLLGLAILVGGSIQGILFIQRSRDRKLRDRDYWLLLLLTCGVPLSALFGLTSTPIPLMGLLISSFHGAMLGSSAVILLTGAMVFGGTMPLKLLISSSAGAMVASLVANRLRSREELALLGGTVGLTQGTVYLLLHLITFGGSSWVNVIGIATLHGFSGFVWCVVALGISPYLEHLFDLITPIRLAELSNPNRPLLKRLATEAPGTFQHTLFVSTLAEAAARALGCNIELVRAGCLYHDIGKMHDPLAFIENQLGCDNKHDHINDPWVSADLIKKHVTEGIVMARKHRLPKAIEVFIPEHQGTMLIAYFHHQAQVQAETNSELKVEELDFRYDGPAPQSRETAIVMLADSCEAALRSLKNAEPNVALSTVHKIFKARWHDHQIQDSGLKEEEMPKIAEIFVRVWQEYNHQRIVYPKALMQPRLAEAAFPESDDPDSPRMSKMSEK